MKTTCAISGITFETPYFSGLSVPAKTGYFHPIFAISHTQLYACYTAYCEDKLTIPESYLTLLAFLHSSECVSWNAPACLAPSSSSTASFVAINLHRLVSVLQKTDTIKHPSFKQPSFSVTYDNNNLRSLAGWLEAWEDNIDRFYSRTASIREQETLQAIENKLTLAITSGTEPAKYATILANWASMAAEFPPTKDELYKTIIRSSFNSAKMFSTSKEDIEELATYCQCNIEAGSVHFHELSKALERAKKANLDYLGLGGGFTLLDSDTNLQPEKNLSLTASLTAISDLALTLDKLPIESEYDSKVDYIRAKLAYRASTKGRDKLTVQDNKGKTL